MSKCLVFSTVKDEDKSLAFKHWINVEKDYRTAIAYTGFDFKKEQDLDSSSNYFFNTTENNNIKNFLTFYNYFLDERKHQYDYYFLINSNLFFPNYFFINYFKEVAKNKIDISSPVFEKGSKYKILTQRLEGENFSINECSNEAVCLSKKAAKKLHSYKKKRIKFNSKNFDKLSFMAINFTPIKYV